MIYSYRRVCFEIQKRFSNSQKVTKTKMLNISITRLTRTGNFLSPYFHSANRVMPNQISFKNSQFSKFSFSAIFSRDKDNLNIGSSSFSSFLSPAITVSNTHISNEDVHSRIFRKQNGKFHVYDTIFSNCNSMSENNTGGALSCYGEKLFLNVERTGFIRCSSAVSGGSIFALCNTFILKSVCFEQSSAPKNFDIDICSDIISTNLTTFSMGQYGKTGAASTRLEKGEIGYTQCNFTSIYSPMEAAIFNAKSFASLYLAFGIATNVSGYGIFLVISPSDKITFAYLKLWPCGLKNQSIFYTATKIILKDSVILSDAPICQKTNNTLCLLHTCYILADEEKWKRENENAENIAVLFINDASQAESLFYHVDQFSCWDKGSSIMSYLLHANSTSATQQQGVPNTKLFVKTFILASSATTMIMVFIISFFMKDKKRKPKAFKAPPKLEV